MKVARLHRFGGPEVLEYDDVTPPTPKPGEALVKTEAIGVNYTDVNSRAGVSPAPLPLIPGREAAGHVIQVGDGVEGVSVGDLVGFCGINGTYAEQVCVPAWQLIKLPQGIDVRAAAGSLLQGMTAHYLVFSTYPLQPGDSCLVHAGAGGTGLMVIQMAKRAGAKVITTVSTKEKEDLARDAGADIVINYLNQDFEAETLNATNGHGVQVVYDAVGKTTFDKSISCLASLGVMALYGAASGPVPPQDLGILSAKSLFITRPALGAYTADRKSLSNRANDVLNWLLSGELKLRISKEFHLSEAAEAHRQLQSRASTGKLLLIP
ncbi:quinone oxidoreductase [SAR202 cluster bacterium AD-804-J14_MRT_500m]|nr:quinone oxidoreductase [SAR202 cluster bacterium AD-804-J14_MRT_500m]